MRRSLLELPDAPPLCRRSIPTALTAGACLLVCLLAAEGSRADEDAPLRKLFPSEAPVHVEREGLLRLELPAEILRACRPDLSDVRLFGPDRREIPFLLDSLPPRAEGVGTLRRIEAAILEADRREIRRESGPPLRRETYEIASPVLPSSAPTQSWVLVFETRRPLFVCRVDVAALAAAGSGTPARQLLQGGSLFRISGARSSEKTRLPLPPFTAARLRVTLESEEGAWLEPSFRFESARLFERSGRIAVPLSILSREREEPGPGENGATVLELERPRGLVPDLLRLETATPTFDRRVVVRDEGPGGGGEVLGETGLFRVKALTPVEDLEIQVRPARGDRLRVRIEDGDSPPLESVAFSAVVRQPSMIFSLAAPAVAGDEERGEGGGKRKSAHAAMLLFGGGRAYPPRYDLAGFLPPPEGALTAKRASAAARLYDPAALGRAWLGEVRPNPDFDRSPALAFAMRPGAPIDVRRFRHRRQLRVPATPEGLSVLRLAPDDLALLRDDLADIRIVDAESRQQPFLLEHEAAEELVEMDVDGPASKGGRSRYRLRPRVAPVRVERIMLGTPAEFFDREFSLTAVLPGGDDTEKTIATGRLAHAVGARTLATIELAPVRVASLELTLVDGDDAPLAFHTARARILLPEIYIAAPAGDYFVMLGAPDEEAPRYELARMRDVVLAVKSARVSARALEENPELSLSARLGSNEGRHRILMWAVLVTAVVVLVALTLRLARRESGGAGTGPGA